MGGCAVVLRQQLAWWKDPLAEGGSITSTVAGAGVSSGSKLGGGGRSPILQQQRQLVKPQ